MTVRFVGLNTLFFNNRQDVLNCFTEAPEMALRSNESEPRNGYRLRRPTQDRRRVSR